MATYKHHAGTANDPLTLTDFQNLSVSLPQAPAGGYVVNVSSSDLAASVTSSGSTYSLAGYLDVTASSYANVNLTSGTFTIDANTARGDLPLLNKMTISSGAQVVVSDTAAHVSSNLSTLSSLAQNGHITSISLSDNGSLGLNASQAAGAASAIDLINNQDGSPAKISVSDTASNLQPVMSSLQSEFSSGHLISVTATSGTLNLGISDISITNPSGASFLSTVHPSGVNLNLSSADINATYGSGANSLIDKLNAQISHFSTVSITGSDPIKLSASEFSGDSALLSKIAAGTPNYSLSITDTAATLSSNLNNLLANSHVASISSTDSAIPLTVNQLSTYNTALHSKLADGTTLNLNDTAVQVGGAFDSLNSNAFVSKISVSDGAPVVLSAAQLSSDSTALSKLLSGTPNYEINVTDKGGNLGGTTFDALNANTHVTHITTTDNVPVALSASQLTNSQHALTALSAGSPSYHVNLTDSGANLGGAFFDSINKNSHITQLTLTDSSPVTLTSAQLEDTHSITMLASANPSYQLKIQDSATQISQSLNTLEHNLTHISSISVNDAGTNSVTLSHTDIQTGILGKITTAGSVIVNSDSLAHLSTDFTSLASAVKSGVIGDVTLANHSGALNISAADFSNGGDAILKMLSAQNQLPTSLTVDGHNLSAYEIQNNILPCYVFGTHIQTHLGPKLVQELEVGDLVKTIDGRLEPVIWIGSRRVLPSMQAKKEKAYPVRIVKDAFGENLPLRDLLVSPDHSLYVDGLMIPADKLLNGKTIMQEKWSQVTYFHVELPKHEAIYAEGLPAETYLDTSETNRAFFNNATGDGKVFDASEEMPAPKDVPLWRHIWDTQGYGKLTTSGPLVESIKARLNARADEMIQEVTKAA